MGERPQRVPRIRKRLAVRFGGLGDPSGRGFTINLSSQGMAISTNSLPKLGAVLYLEFILASGRVCRAEGQIMWAQRGLGQAGTIGVRLRRADEEYYTFVWKLVPPETHLPKPAPPPVPRKLTPDAIPIPKRSAIYIPPPKSAKDQHQIEPAKERFQGVDVTSSVPPHPTDASTFVFAPLLEQAERPPQQAESASVEAVAADAPSPEVQAPPELDASQPRDPDPSVAVEAEAVVPVEAVAAVEKVDEPAAPAVEEPRAAVAPEATAAAAPALLPPSQVTLPVETASAAESASSPEPAPAIAAASPPPEPVSPAVTTDVLAAAEVPGNLEASAPVEVVAAVEPTVAPQVMEAGQTPEVSPAATTLPPDTGEVPGEVLEELPDYLTMVAEEAAADQSAEPDAPSWWMPPWEADQQRNNAPPVAREPRLPARLAIQFGVGVALDRLGTTLNLSATGMAVAVPVPAEPGEMVVFAINSASGISRGAGMVVWVREVASTPPETCIGVRLIHGDSRYRALLDSLARRSPAVA